MFSARITRVVLISLLTMAAYISTAMLGLAMPVVPPSVTLFWPPIGIALTVLYRCGWRYWPVVFLSATIVNAFDLPIWAALQIAIGNTLAPGAAMVILRVTRFQHFENTFSDLLKMLLASKFGALISASNGAMAIWLNGHGTDATVFLRSLTFWWMGDFAGLLYVGTLGLTACREDLTELRQKLGLFLLYIIGLVLITLGLFVQPFPDRADYKILAISSLVAFVTTVAMTTRLAIGLGLSVLLACVVIVGTAQGYGPLVDPQSQYVTLTSVWSWLIVNILIVTILGSLHQALKKAHVELDDEKRSYQALVEGNPALILRFSSTGEILFANDTANKLFDETGRTVVGENITRHIPQEDLHKVYELLVSPDSPTNLDLQLTSVDGSKHIIRWKARNLRRGTSMPPEFLAVGFDVTDLRRAERERREFLERLYHSKKLESLGVMAGGIAHDFNNLLTAMMGHTELAKELVSADEPLGQHIAQIEQSAHRAAELIEQMMAYAGQTRVKISQFDLNELIRSTLELIRINLSAKVEVRFNPTESMLLVQADPVQIRQVLMNLIINAGEAIGENSGKIDIQADSVALRGDELLDSSTSETRVNLPPGDYVRVRVRDTGPGMDEATRRRIFEPFFSTKFQGRGLGLASVLGIIQAHSGTIGVSSHPGRGTLFTFLLPASYRKPSDAVGTPSIQGISSTDMQALPTSGFAFISLGSPELRAMIVNQVQLLGWQIITENVRVKLEDTLKNSPQMPILVVLALSSNDPNNLGIQKLLRTAEPPVRTLLVTDFELNRTPEDVAIPSSTFLITPFTPTDLVNALIRLFSPSR